MTSPGESDGINEILEGAHRAASSGAMRFAELAAWRGRDKAYDRADGANRQLDRQLAENDMARGRQVLADEMAERHVTVGHPDDPMGAPIYDGPLVDAPRFLADGTYAGSDDRDNELIVTVDGGTAEAAGAVDPAERAQLQAQAEATLAGQEAFTGADVDDVLYGWAAERSVRGNSPEGYDGQYWRDWAVMEADDDQLAAAADAAREAGGSAQDRLAAAYNDLQSRVEMAARADTAWRAAAGRRAHHAVGLLHADGLARAAEPSPGPVPAGAVGAEVAGRGVKTARTAPDGARAAATKQTAESMALHDMAFAGREHPNAQRHATGKTAAASRSRAVRRGTDRSRGR